MKNEYRTCEICGSEDLEYLERDIYKCLNCNYFSNNKTNDCIDYDEDIELDSLEDFDSDLEVDDE